MVSCSEIEKLRENFEPELENLPAMLNNQNIDPMAENGKTQLLTATFDDFQQPQLVGVKLADYKKYADHKWQSFLKCMY